MALGIGGVPTQALTMPGNVGGSSIPGVNPGMFAAQLAGTALGSAFSSGPAGPAISASNPIRYADMINVSPSVLNLGELIKQFNAGPPQNGGGAGMEVKPLNTSNLNARAGGFSLSPVAILGIAGGIGLVMVLIK